MERQTKTELEIIILLLDETYEKYKDSPQYQKELRHISHAYTTLQAEYLLKYGTICPNRRK